MKKMTATKTATNKKKKKNKTNILDWMDWLAGVFEYRAALLLNEEKPISRMRQK